MIGLRLKNQILGSGRGFLPIHTGASHIRKVRIKICQSVLASALSAARSGRSEKAKRVDCHVIGETLMAPPTDFGCDPPSCLARSTSKGNDQLEHHG